MSEVVLSHEHFNRSKAGVVTVAGSKSKIDSLTLVIVLLIASFYLSTIRTGHLWGDDFSVYAQHAQNIVKGIDYSFSNYLYLPPYVGPNAYPPVFPLLMVPVVWIWGVNFTALKVEIILLFVVALLLLSQIVKDFVPITGRAALLILVGFNPYFWNFKDNVVSEIPFLVTTYLSVLLVQKYYESNAVGWMKLGYVLFTGVSFYLAYGTRSVGLILLPSLVLYDLARNRKPTLYPIGVAVVTIALAAFQSYLLRSDRSYVEMVQPGSQNFLYNWLVFIRSNFFMYSTSLTEIWDNGYSKYFRLGLTIAMTGLAVVGYAAQLIKKINFVKIFVALYTISIVIVPMTGGLRYLLPVVPFYIFYSLQGLKMLPLTAPIKKGLIVTCTLSVVLAYLGGYSRQSFGAIPNGVSKQEAVEFFDYVNERTTEQHVIVFAKPRALSLFTGRKSSFFPIMLEDEKVWEYFRKIQATHIVVGPDGVEPYVQGFFARFVGKYSSYMRQEYSNADFQVYRIMKLPETF